MGGLMSRFRTADEGDYKRILAELDDKIRLEEVRLSEIRVREKRSRIIWLVYASLFYVVYTVGWYFFGWRTSDVQEHWTMYGLKAMPVFVFPVIIFAVNNMMGWWYRRKQANEETQLGHLRAQQKLKLEELKKKTDYYAIKTLLEQYDAQSGQELRHRLSQPAATLQQPNGATANGDTLRPIIVAGSDRPRTGAPVRVKEPLPVAPVQRAWYDRLLDAIVGDAGSSTKYALICASCHNHNGLVPQQELDDVAYVCPKCSSFNPSRKAIREGTAFQPSTSDDPSAPAATAVTVATAGKGNITPPRGRSTTPRPTTTSTSRDRHNHFNQVVDSSQPYDLDDYDDDGVAVSKRLASRSNSRKRHRSRSQNGISGRRGSTGDVRRRYDTDTEDESINRPS